MMVGTVQNMFGFLIKCTENTNMHIWHALYIKCVKLMFKNIVLADVLFLGAHIRFG